MCSCVVVVAIKLL